jgi:hypothetical protein
LDNPQYTTTPGLALAICLATSTRTLVVLVKAFKVGAGSAVPTCAGFPASLAFNISIFASGVEGFDLFFS